MVMLERMLPPERVLLFVAAAVVLVAIPGPSVLFVVSRALAYGRRVALLTVAGGAAGSFVMAAAVAVGMGAVVQTSAVVYEVIKLVGAAYLVYLGARAFRDRRQLSDAFADQVGHVRGSRTFRQGFVVALTNPKTAVFFAAVLPQFVDPATGSTIAQMLTLGAIFAAIALALDSVWAMLAATVRSWFARSTRRLEVVGGTAGLTMMGLGVGLAFTGREN